MEAKIFDGSGTAYALPSLIAWEINHGFCSPSDSFELTFLYLPEMLLPLTGACRMQADNGGETVFYGVVDEFELSAGGGGCYCVLRGRGMQALLLDSEAESADYFGADVEYILSRHVRPLGVTDIDPGAAAGKKASFSVSSGESHWSVLKRYAEFCLGMTPRFTKEGKLLLDGARSGRTLLVDDSTAVTAQTYNMDRYGVVSEAIVKTRSYGTRVTVKNPEIISLGGQCIRVINVPRKTAYDSMKHTGAYQIEQSRKDLFRCRITLPQCFAAFPGDKVILKKTPLGITGEYIVTATRSYASGAAAGTVIDLRKEGSANVVG